MSPGRPRGTGLVLALLALVAGVTLAYWVTFFTSGATHVREDDVYLAFENAFPLADTWMGLCAVCAAHGIWRGRSWGLLFGLLTGGCLVYLGCLDVLFNVNAGNYGIEGAAMGAEIVINAGSLAIGLGLIAWCWRHREALLRR